MIVSIPFLEQVYSSLYTGADSNGIEYDINLPQKYVKIWAETNSIPYYDLMLELRSQVRDYQATLYPQTNLHFNNEGHFIVGQLVAEFFKEAVSNE